MSNTRWESRIKSVKVIRYQAPQIRAALIELYDLCDDAISKSETESLVDALENFEFLLGIVIWHDILFAINMVSKKLQNKSICIDNAMKQVEGVMSLKKIEMMDVSLVKCVFVEKNCIERMRRLILC